MKILATRPWKEWEKQAISRAVKDAEFLEPGPVPIEELIEEADVLFGSSQVPLDRVASSKTLKLVQARSTGADRFLTEEFKKSKIILTTARGVHAPPVAEHAVALMMAVAYNFRTNDKNQREKTWGEHSVNRLYGKTAGILGMGTIGEEIAKRCKGLDMNVIGTRKDPSKGSANVEKVFPLDRLPEFLASSDVVLCSLPGTPDTYHFLAEKEFRVMKPSALVINVGRGSVINEKDLIKALSEGWIAGAGLDVFEEEPLPPDSPLWDMPNVVITPHSAGYAPDNERKIIEILIQNLVNLQEGLPLVNVVDKEAGY
ncbi:MAG TPA: D-2-hydroxyacid dehydrogenase [Firmicutes bacterium]|nr:D-2-hydroxyacid dehydrogenase [Candidatus Fermentithermobacillaceae bacterium]